MKTKFLIPVLLLAGFVGISSCGDNADTSKDAELAALRARIAAGNIGTAANVNTTVTQTAVATVTVNTTVSNTSSNTNTSITRQ